VSGKEVRGQRTEDTGLRNGLKSAGRGDIVKFQRKGFLSFKSIFAGSE
jgi:hypothetical protein